MLASIINPSEYFLPFAKMTCPSAYHVTPPPPSPILSFFPLTLSKLLTSLQLSTVFLFQDGDLNMEVYNHSPRQNPPALQATKLQKTWRRRQCTIDRERNRLVADVFLAGKEQQRRGTRLARDKKKNFCYQGIYGTLWLSG